MPRYIDAEALETALLAEQNCDRSNAYGVYECDLIAHVYESARQLCERIPTANVEPVRHGRWKDGNCSVCSVPAVTMRQVDGIELRVETPRCPNCGAKMDGEAI